MKQVVSSNKAPKSPILLSSALVHNYSYTMEISGQIGMDPLSSKLVPGGITAETEQALKNIRALLHEVGWDCSHIIKVRLYLVTMDDYAKVNEIYKIYFSEPLPTRVAIGVKELPLGARIEIECIAAGNSITSNE